MEIRSATTSYAKYKAKASYLRKKEIKQQLDHLDVIICNNLFCNDVHLVLQEYDDLKTEL